VQVAQMKNADIKLSAHDTFLEQLSSSMLKIERLKKIKVLEKPEYLERTTYHGQATGKLYHLRLRVECTLFVIYKVGRDPCRIGNIPLIFICL
jgi:hypothetical protein